MPGFPDHFSSQAGAYARSRPTYPPALFAWVGRIAPRVGGVRRVWDVGCGSGQASVGLAAHFDEVIATDASVAQLAHAATAPRVAYAAALAERAPIGNGSIALVTVAQALHWMRLDEFYAEVARVCGRGAVLVAWSYGITAVDADVDALVRAFHEETVGPWWPEERRHVDAGYATLDFPFRAVEAPPFAMTTEWTCETFIDYVDTWSAVARMRAGGAGDPLPGLARALARIWGRDEPRTVRWPLAIRAGVVHPG